MRWSLLFLCAEKINEYQLEWDDFSFGLRMYEDISKKYPIQEWKEVTKPYHLTIGDVENMEKGQVTRFLCLDRNFEDFLMYNDTPDRPMDFCKNNYVMEYTHNKDMWGRTSWKHDNFQKPFDFEFDIEIREGWWYPMFEGRLPEQDQQYTLSFGDCPRDYREFPKETRIGWRGPMIRWEELKELPMLDQDIFY